jgi:hypothetical protein
MHSQPPPADVERAILRTVAYSDVFDYPLTETEVHRYLDGVAASPPEVTRGLRRLTGSALRAGDDLVALAGREELFDLRRRRRRQAERLWPAARRWGSIVGRLPLVRMVAVTGALAVDNLTTSADIDFLIATKPGRVWLCRSLVIQTVRAARLQGVALCPNWLLAADALELEHRTLFAAREMTQMVPVVGLDLYRRIRAVNPWTEHWLPNALGPPRSFDHSERSRGGVTRVCERVLCSRAGAAVENWERRRKTREILGSSPTTSEVVLDANQCKGHVDAHGEKIARAYAERLCALGLDGSGSAPSATAT